MKKVSRFHKLAIVVAMLAGCMLSCSDQNTVEPPFMPTTGISFDEMAKSVAGPNGMTGDAECFIVWKLNATEQQISRETSGLVVHDKLCWQTGRTDQFDKTMKYFEGYDNYIKFRTNILDVAEDPDVRYAYTELNIETNGYVKFATMWICSPRAKKIAFLCGF
jgi:hypothetical protein